MRRTSRPLCSRGAGSASNGEMETPESRRYRANRQGVGYVWGALFDRIHAHARRARLVIAYQ